MYTGNTLFAQLMDFLPWTTFARIAERYGGDRYVKSLRCTEHFRVMAFCATDLSRQPQRHRSLPVGPSLETLSHGVSRADSNGRRCLMQTKPAIGGFTLTSPRC